MDELSRIDMPQLMFLFAAVLVLWGVFRPRGRF
jgi:hypothetical protein